MHVVVCIKQVPDTAEVKIDPKTGTLIREGVPSIINPDDKHAIEAGLWLKDTKGAKVTVLSMGPPQADEAMREALAMGVDEAILLSDRAFAAADTLATAVALGSAIKKLGGFDLVICGRQATDGDTAQVGPQLAEFLQIPQATYVKKIELQGRGLKVQRMLEDGYETIETPFPSLITVTKDLNAPRYPTVRGIWKAYKEQKVPVWTAADVGVDKAFVGATGSPTSVRRTFTPEPKGTGEVLKGDAATAARTLATKLREKNVV